MCAFVKALCSEVELSAGCSYFIGYLYFTSTDASLVSVMLLVLVLAIKSVLT